MDEYCIVRKAIILQRQLKFAIIKSIHTELDEKRINSLSEACKNISKNLF